MAQQLNLVPLDFLGSFHGIHFDVVEEECYAIINIRSLWPIFKVCKTTEDKIQVKTVKCEILDVHPAFIVGFWRVYGYLIGKMIWIPFRQMEHLWFLSLSYICKLTVCVGLFQRCTGCINRKIQLWSFIWLWIGEHCTRPTTCYLLWLTY